MNVYTLNEIIEGTISEIRPYGALISFPGGRTGLLHIKQISDAYISNINTYLQNGAQIRVRIIEIDPLNNFMKLSLKTVPQNERIVFERDKKNNDAIDLQVDFTPLEKALPEWINKAIKEIEDND